MSSLFRRKQDVILGIDSSSYADSRNQSVPLGTGVSRGDTLRSLATRSIKTASVFPHHITHTRSPISDSDDEQEHGSRGFMDIRRETESILAGKDYEGNRGQSPAADLDPFNGDEDGEGDEYDSLDEELNALPQRVPTRTMTLPPANKVRGSIADSFASGRSASAMGHRHSPREAAPNAGVSSKAQKLLGLSSDGSQTRAHSVSADQYRREHTCQSESLALAPKAQRLLGVRTKIVGRIGSGGSTDRLATTVEDLDTWGRRTTGRGSADNDDYHHLLAGVQNDIVRLRRAETNSDTSSISRSSLVESHSQTSRSSRELIFPDGEKPTWTASNSAAPPWLGLHPAFRGPRSAGGESLDAFSPISPCSDSSKTLPFSARNATNIPLKTKGAEFLVAPEELDASPHTPVELAGPDVVIRQDTRRTPSPSSGRQAPRYVMNQVFNHPQHGTPTSRTNPHQFPPAPASAKQPPTVPPARKNNRPSAIFENPNIFELPAMEAIPSPQPPSPPVTSSSRDVGVPTRFPTPSAQSSRAHSPNSPRISPSPSIQRSRSPASRPPYPPPKRPLPPPPPPPRRRSSSSVAVDTAAKPPSSPRSPSESEKPARFREDSQVDVAPSTVNFLNSAPESISNPFSNPRPASESLALSSRDSVPAPTITTTLTAPSQLAIVIEQGSPIASKAPPLKPIDEQHPHAADATGRKRVELVDSGPPGAASSAEPPHASLAPSSAATQASADGTAADRRPFSFESVAHLQAQTQEPKRRSSPAPAPLRIPSLAQRARAAQEQPHPHTAPPRGASSARSRASQLEHALEQALSKEGMERALRGERIEDIFKSAAEVLHIDEIDDGDGEEAEHGGVLGGVGEKREMGVGEEDVGDEGERSRQGSRARTRKVKETLLQLTELQREVDALRGLYAEGAMLDEEERGQSGVGRNVSL